MELTAGESLSTGFTQRIVDSGRIRAFEKLAENTNIAQHSREGYHYRRTAKKGLKGKKKQQQKLLNNFGKCTFVAPVCA